MKGRKVTIAGYSFLEVRQEEIWLRVEPCPEPDRLVLILHRDRENPDYLEFPDGGDFESHDFGGSPLTLATDGFSRHEFWSELPDEEPLGFKGRAGGFSARQVNVLSDSFHGECQCVMDAHGWMEGLDLPSREIQAKLLELEGPEVMSAARERFGDNCRAFFCELAAVHFSKPFSRLWYAANMFSLYYAHYDDLRVGFLWAEYQIRMRQGSNARRGEKTKNAARSGGEARRHANEALRQAVVEAMAPQIHNGLSISRAATLAYKGGVGSSPEANRRLFNRLKKAAGEK
ncbi:hypothetical protein [Marimonas arenosa]|uniref:Uncharacterized protein n=1 Tax=Marimonas arenosa TaxID=1795305 RepID=A0AAE3WC39_9RHOB|nr:hypothetical protein [Marimonas arenosa]MDQ2089753.1 hypothetical protein [Marimonas arenosa]